MSKDSTTQLFTEKIHTYTTTSPRVLIPYNFKKEYPHITWLKEKCLKHGLTTMCIDTNLGANIEALNKADIVILPGDDEVEVPESWEHNSSIDTTSTSLDKTLCIQTQIAQRALQTGTPLIGICRGAQLLNVWR